MTTKRALLTALTEIDVCGRVPADLVPTLVPQLTGKPGKAACSQEPTALNKAGYPAADAPRAEQG